jgi:D-alanyl-D-alanine carboxypeptidase
MNPFLPSTRRVAGAFAIACLAACGGGNEPDSPQHRAEITRAVDARLKALQVQYPAVPGIVTHVLVQPARLSWGGSRGTAERATQRALTPNATFRTASVTKPFTAAAIFRLTEQKALATSDSIERHVSAASVATLRAGGYDTAAMTIDHLLTHRSGLPDHALSPPYLQAVLADPTHRWSRAEQLGVAMALGRPLAAPGVAYHYSDTGYILLGEMIELKTGLQLGAAFRSLLGLSSLGLVATYQESIDPAPPFAGPRAHQELLAGVDDTMIDASTDLWGSGGLVSDARDLALFMRALLDGKVLGAESLRAMQTVATTLSGPPNRFAYARGLTKLDVGGITCWGHNAFSGAFAVHCPEPGITVAGSILATEFVGAPDAFAVAVDLVAAIAAVK